MARVTAASTAEARLKSFAVDVFRDHWKKVLSAANRREETFMESAWKFAAPSIKERGALASQFFGEAHAKEICAKSRDEVETLLSVYLDDSIQYADDNGMSPKEFRAFLTELVTGVYVLFDVSWTGCLDWGIEINDCIGSVASFPEDCVYNDWYERSLATGAGRGSFVLMKSTGEEFSLKELLLLKREIQTNLDEENGDQDLWGMECDYLSSEQLFFKYSETDRQTYVEELMQQVKALDDAHLSVFLRRVRRHLPVSDRFSLESVSRVKALNTLRKLLLFEETFVPVSARNVAEVNRRAVGAPRVTPKRAGKGKRRRQALDLVTVSIADVERIFTRLVGVKVREYHSVESW